MMLLVHVNCGIPDQLRLRLTLMLCDPTGSSGLGFVFAQPACRRRRIEITFFGTCNCISWSGPVLACLRSFHALLQSLRALLRNTLRFNFTYLRQVVHLSSTTLREVANQRRHDLALVFIVHRRRLFAQCRQLVRTVESLHWAHVAKTLRFNFLDLHIGRLSHMSFVSLTHFFFLTSLAVECASQL